MDQSTYLEESDILDFSNDAIAQMPQWKTWMALGESQRAAAIYDFVRNGIAFGYNSSDLLPASAVLNDGYGQCNTKSTLFMALLRKAGIPCRFHGFTIDKRLQRGAIPELVYWLAPQSIIHSWVETLIDGTWIKLEGFILDDPYLNAVQKKYSSEKGAFIGYGIATKNLQNPKVNWCGSDTFIQKEGINHDYGLFDTPDDFYKKHGTNEKGIKGWFYSNYLRHLLNRNVHEIRNWFSQDVTVAKVHVVKEVPSP